MVALGVTLRLTRTLRATCFVLRHGRHSLHYPAQGDCRPSCAAFPDADNLPTTGPPPRCAGGIDVVPTLARQQQTLWWLAWSRVGVILGHVPLRLIDGLCDDTAVENRKFIFPA